MLRNPQTTLTKPSKARFDIAFLAKRCVASSSTPSQYVKYSLVRASLAPCASSKSVGFYCGKHVERLFIASVQAVSLYTKSTVSFSCLARASFISTGLHTAFAQIYCAFAQAILPIFNQLATYFYTLSTVPIITTNLIKE